MNFYCCLIIIGLPLFFANIIILPFLKMKLKTLIFPGVALADLVKLYAIFC